MPDISSIGRGQVGPVDRSAPSGRADVDHSSYASHTSHAPHAPPERPGDRVELSEHARFLDRIRQLPDARFDRVEQIRDAIESGTYETESKLDDAIDRLVDDLID